VAAITTTQAGNWNLTATWTGGVVPGNGDTVTLNHAVTVSDARTVGVSPAAGAGTNAIRSNAVLTIASGGVLTVRGDIGLNNVGLTIQAGGILEWDASQAGTPSTARYRLFDINAAASPNAIVTITGTTGSHAVVRSNAGGANGRFTDNGTDESGMVDATFCDFLRIGDSANAAFTFLLGSGRTFSLVDCTLDACGPVGNQLGAAAAGDAILRFVRVRMTNSVGSLTFAIPSAARTGAGVRDVKFCDLDKNSAFYELGGYTVEDTIFRGAYDISQGVPASFTRNVLAFPQSDAGDWGAIGTVVDCYCVRLGNPTNAHYFTTTDDTVRITACVFDMPDGTDGAGDCITINAPSAARTITIDHNIGLHANNICAGTMLSCLGGVNLTVIADHNTYHGDFGIYVGETYAGHAGMLASAKSNLSYHKTAASSLIIRGEPGVIQNVIQGVNATRNGVWNPANTDGYGSGLSFSPAAHGAGDVIGDPQFKNIDRNIKTWDTTLGGPGTIANALDQIGTGARTVQALLDYIRDGFTPRNSAFRNAHDSVAPSRGWIGAVEGSDPIRYSYANFSKDRLKYADQVTA